tara:strand:+ start:155 stop:433 length:279 start_codon:yes stop_codon:yes gene_type:complete
MKILFTKEQQANQDAELIKWFESLPSGRVTARWVHARNCFQVYKGRGFVSGCSGSTEFEALDSFWDQVNCDTIKAHVWAEFIESIDSESIAS